GENMVRKDTVVQIFANMDKQDAVAVLPATALVPVTALTASLKSVDGLFAVYNKKKNLVEIISEKNLEFGFGIPLWLFVSLTVVLGFFMSLGKAAVFKHIPVYYPNHVGSVGGIVGLIGGLGGFILPITFGVMNDLIGVWTSCFMLLSVLITIALIWMHFAIRRMEIQQYPELRSPKYLPELATDDESILAIIEGEALRQHSELLATEALKKMAGGVS
ncbi:MAG: MFS transporter, partial [Alphaproteobacteria bacterium]|nr:MFS transporter [Alphaproteobacteria bacterium]